MPKIIAAGVGLPLIGTGATVTTSQPLLNLTQTWNGTGVTFTGLKFNATDTASAAGSLLMDLQVGGVSQFNISKIGSAVATGNVTAGGFAARIGTTGVIAASSVPIGFSSTTSTTGTLDVLLNRDAPNTLALRNGTAAQGLNVYNTYTDASNYERGVLGWSGNALIIGTDNLGTGTLRATTLTGSTVSLKSGATSRWQVDTSGNYITFADNAYDIGANGANRPRDVYIGTATYTPVLRFNALGSVEASGDGNVLMRNNAGTDFGMLKFGGTSSTFPAMKRSGTEIQFRLADDSAYSDIRANKVFAHYGIVFNQSGYISPSADGKFVFADKAGASFGMIQLGGTTSSFPALRRTGTALDAVLADASAYSAINASQFISQTSGFKFNASTLMSAPADGQFRLLNNAGTDFTRLILGPNDASGVAIKKNGTSFSFVLGDDSAFASVVVSALYSNSFVKTQSIKVADLTAAATAGAGARSFVTDANATMAAGVGTAVVGGGANKVPVYSDGTNWLIG